MLTVAAMRPHDGMASCLGQHLANQHNKYAAQRDGSC